MNANELADELKNHMESLRYETTESIAVATSFYEECETTLRQQQAEIEQWGVEFDKLTDDFMKQQAEIEALKEGIEKLKDAYCQKDHEVKKAEQYCLDAFERGRQIGYADGMINRKAQEK